MTKSNNYLLKTDDEFKRLIPPLSANERKQLEENILSDGCREPLCVWNKTILDGHNRYAICTQHHIPFAISYVFLKSREEAVAWICANQLGRRSITDETRRYLIGKRYEMEKILAAHNAAGTNQYARKEGAEKILTNPPFDETACRTRERLGNEYNLSFATVGRYGSYANAIDLLSKIEPGLTPKILSGKVKIPHERVIELARLTTPEIKQVSMHLSKPSADSISFLDTRKMFPKKKTDPKSQIPSIPVGSVKDMPNYDPDAEILSLTFTIPSWISSIDRVRSTANLLEVSNNAKSRLQRELSALSSSVQAIILLIEEGN